MDCVIRAIIFDFDGTLAYTMDMQVAYYQELLPKFGYPCPSAEEVKESFKLPNVERMQRLTGGATPDRIKEILGSKEAAKFPYEKVRFPGNALEVLSGLEGDGYVLAIATSAPSSFIAGCLDVYNLKDKFPVVVASGAYKNPKPDPESLLITAEKLGLKPEECIHVGDQEKDVIAAKACGMKSVLIADRSEGNANLRIDALSQLPAAVIELQKASQAKRLKD